MLDYETIFIAIGGLITVLTFLYGILKPQSKKDDTSAAIRAEIESIKSEAMNLKKMIDNNDKKTVRAVERLEDRLQKITDLLIDHIRKD